MLSMAIDMNVYLKLFCLILDLKPCLSYSEGLSVCDSSFEYSHHVLAKIFITSNISTYLKSPICEALESVFFLNHVFCYYISLTDI